ncbi:argonaute/piwi family protein [Prosthecochloris sp. SCSIO W1103]|uniref:argonaute/piwi family protein n=1 Tax=Prosthecochloris sp. SCSIO W1103 TaxID=2992244 RepID=UPI00223C8CAA|nr:Piwi domain-containing protein [Prosthecochloris sp. SCSIO W1103]UZJ36620.1 Piwi domain-containing protein [Prosthecochloris sp. SCSIO W1103]
MRNKPDLRINLIPITFDKGKFAGSELPYIDKNHLKELRELYRDSHVIKKYGSKIQCVPLNDEAELLGQKKQFSVKHDFILASRLVQDSIIRFLKSKNSQFSRLFNPTSIVNTKENLMQGVVDDEIAAMLPMHPEYLFDSRIIVAHNRHVTFGILLDFNICQLIEPTAKELLDKGVDICDCYVVANAPKETEGGDSRFTRNLVGRVMGTNGHSLKLDDCREQSEIDTASCYLEASPGNVRRCLLAISDKDIQAIQSEMLEQVFKVKGAKNQAERIEKVRDWLERDQPFYCGGGLSFNIGSDILELKVGNEAGKHHRLQNPSFVLKPGGSITVHGSVDKKIDEKGPYDSESFPKKRIKIAVIYPDRFKDEVEIFFRQFKYGVPQRTGKDVVFAQGFIRKYRLIGCEFRMFPIASQREDSIGYKQASLSALQAQDVYDLAMIVIKEDFHQLHGESNPYLVSKSAFMSQGVPVQSIEIETIRDQRGRPWILNNIGLASYAKIGGIPYMLTSRTGLTHELIFGIGSSNIKSRRLGSLQRFIGITTVFSGDGNYLLYNLTKEVLFEDYQEALLQSLKNAIDEIKERYAWQKGDSVRLIFHQSFKKFKAVEAQAVKDLVNSLTDFQVEYAFIHVSDSHPWKVFDKNAEGKTYWYNYQKFSKGEYVPFRGHCIPLGPNTGLLTLSGPHQLKTHLQGCPEPVLVSIHPESTFKNWEYLASQVFNLTFMSWRSFFPSSKPVSIEYSDFIAKMMGSLKDIANWNPDILTTKLRESRWFL